jgi:hypothetical protein
MTAGRPKPSLAWAALALGIVAILGVGALAARPPLPVHEVAVPPDDAPPEEVVLAYLEAMDGHDCATVAELLAAGSRWLGDGCKDADGHGEVRVASVFREKPHWSGHDRGQQVINVSVRFETKVWGYLLMRDTPNYPWRIFDEGVG